MMRMVRKRVSDKVTFEQSLQGSKRIDHVASRNNMDIQGRTFSGNRV